MKLDRLIIHIGTHKAGSTALQACLHENRKLLAQAGYLYPIGRWHAEIASYFTQSDPAFVYNRHAGRRDRDEIIEKDKKALEAFYEQVSNGDFSTVILSYEGFIGLSQDNIRSLIDEFSKHFREIVFHAYARHPLSFATSEFSQQARMGLVKDPGQTLRQCILPFKNYFKNFMFNDKGTRLVVRDFHPDSLIEEDITRDFLTVHGVLDQLPGDLKYPKNRANVSLSSEAIQVAIELARLDENALFEGEFFRKYDTFLSSIRGRKFQFSKKENDTILDLSRTHLDFLEEKFGLRLKKPETHAHEGGWFLQEETAKSIAEMIRKFSEVKVQM